MIHNGHCFHCGQTMAVGSQECGNPLCRVDERARPSWPWSRCAHDNVIALHCASVIPWLLSPAFGILLFLMGNLFVSGRLINISLVCIIGWLLSRSLLSLVRKANIKLFIQEEDRRNVQQEYDRGSIADTPKSRKNLKDAYDRVEYNQWLVCGCQWLKMTVNLAIAMLAIFFILSWGPGNIFHWNIKNWAHDKIEKVVNSPIVADAKRELNWDRHRLNYLENILRRKKGFAYEQFQDIVNYKNFDVEAVIKMLKTTKLRGNKLYDDIKIQLDAVAPPSLKVEEAKTFVQKTQGRFHVLREIYWQLLFWINLLLFIFVVGSFILTLTSFAIAKGDIFVDEIKGVIKQKMEEAEEGRKGKKSTNIESFQQKAIRIIKSPDKGEGYGIFGIVAISLITHLTFGKLFKKFFK